jgi:hypothetical protein
LETYAGIPAATVTWRVMLAFFRQRHHRRAFWQYIRWLRDMQRLRRSSRHLRDAG